MATFRFLHCSDLHLDTPFSGLSTVRPELKEKLRNATFQAFRNIVNLALEERVDAVIVAGDVYDAEDRSLQAQIKFRRELKRLSDAGIPAFVAHGNHDPLDGWSASIERPENVTVFGGRQVEMVPVIRNGAPLACIYGISFPYKKVTDNLALGFKRDQVSGFAIGVLHTNVGGDPGHEDYAPCKMEHLLGAGMDYWALGHIHARRILRDREPAIVYCGNTQARSYKEAGEKGCYLVTLDDHRPPNIRFAAADVIRFHSVDLDLSSCSDLESVLKSIRARCEATSRSAGERDVLIRLNLTGCTAIHSELQKTGSLHGLLEDVGGYFEGREPGIWIDLTVETRGTYDLDLLRRGNDFTADLISLYDEAENPASPDQLLEALKPVLEDWPGNKYLENLSQDALREILLKARSATLDRLADRS